MSPYQSYEIPEMRPVSPLDETFFIDAAERQSYFQPQLPIEQDGQMQMLEMNDSDSSNQRESLEPVRTSFLQPHTRRFIPHWINAFFAIAISIFSVLYSYRVLVSRAEVPKHLSLSPGQTVLVVNVLSHLVAFLCWNLFSDVTEALRWSLACRPQGIFLTSFLALSRATPLMGVAHLCKRRGPHQIWSIQRLIAVGMDAVLGLILITDITYKNVYTVSSNDQTVAVVAGLAPLNRSIISLMPKDILSLFVVSYNMGFITDPKFVVNIDPASNGCMGADCTALFLPGGLDMVRTTGNNATLFTGQFTGDYTTIVIENAPGFQLEFLPLNGTYKFDPNDCTAYGASIKDGMYICLASDGPRMLAGWSVCPSDLSAADRCWKNTTWTEKMEFSIGVTLLQRFSTTAYNRRNGSILTIENIGPPTVLAIDPHDFKIYHDVVLGNIPSILNQSDPNFKDLAVSYTAQHGISWILRVYEDQFSTYNNGGLELLKGFLAVSFQFNTIIWVSFPWAFQSLPQNMHTTATLRKVTYRAIAQSWNVYLFAGLTAVMLFWSIGCLIWVQFYGPSSPNSSHFPEIDITSKASIHSMAGQGGDRVVISGESVEDLSRMTRTAGMGNGTSKIVIDGIMKKRIYCGSYQREKGGAQILAILVEEGEVEPLRQRQKYA